MPLNKVVQPAFKLARDGFIVNDALADDLKTYGSEVLPNHEKQQSYLLERGRTAEKGRQAGAGEPGKEPGDDCRNGPDEFYKGTIAEQIAQEMQKTVA